MTTDTIEQLVNQYLHPEEEDEEEEQDKYLEKARGLISALNTSPDIYDVYVDDDNKLHVITQSFTIESDIPGDDRVFHTGRYIIKLSGRLEPQVYCDFRSDSSHDEFGLNRERYVHPHVATDPSHSVCFGELSPFVQDAKDNKQVFLIVQMTIDLLKSYSSKEPFFKLFKYDPCRYCEMNIPCQVCECSHCEYKGSPDCINCRNRGQVHLGNLSGFVRSLVTDTIMSRDRDDAYTKVLTLLESDEELTRRFEDVSERSLEEYIQMNDEKEE